MINPIEGIPINELSTTFPERWTNVVVKAENSNYKPHQQGLDNFNSFLKEVEQNQKKLTPENKPLDYNKIAKKLEAIIDDPNLMIKFTLDDITKKLIFKLINVDTKEVVQQIPPEVALKIARFIASMLDNQNVANAKI